MVDSPQLIRNTPSPNLQSSSSINKTPVIVENLISSLLPSPESAATHNKALHYAFYNVIALVAAGASILALWTVTRVLEPFIKSLLWALLCGSVLYPFKQRLVSSAKGWMENVKGSNVPFALYVASSPLIIADSISERIGNYVTSCWRWIGGGMAIFFATYVIYYNPPVRLGQLLGWIVTRGYYIAGALLGCVRSEIVVGLMVAYVGVIGHIVMVRNRTVEKHVEKIGNDTEDLVTQGIESKEEVGRGRDVPDDKDNGPSATKIQGGQSEVSETELMVLKIISILTWTMTFLFICRNLPFTILFPFLICMGAGGVAYFRQKTTKSKYTIPHLAITKLVLGIGKTPKLVRSQSFNISSESSPIFSPATPKIQSIRETVLTQNIRTRVAEDLDATDTPWPKPQCTTDEDEVDYTIIDSNKYLYGVFLSCVLVQIWHHLWLMRLLPIPVLYYGIKKACFKIGLIEFLQNNIRDTVSTFYSNETDQLSENIFPPPVRTLLRIMSIADRKLCEFCEAYLDPVASSIILVVVLIITIMFFVFSATQVYLEGDHLVRVSIDLINTTVSQHPEMSELLPEGWEKIMDNAVDNAYVYGKEYITNTVRDSIEQKDPEKAREIEKQVIELWDKIYWSWNNKTFEGSRNDSQLEIHEGSGIEWSELLETAKTVPSYSVLVDYAKANLGTLMSVLESAWNITIGNVSIAISAIMSVLSVLFGGGSALVNLVLNLVVFLTALFYLLNSSTSVYKPVEIFRSSIPGSGKHSSRLLSAIEESVNSVFTASLKMSVFYGMWTWLIHSLFQRNIVFVPSLLAALFGAIPLLAPHMAAIPAVLELFIIQGEWTLAILMMLAQMAPMSMVDTQIYSEVKGGGHPYLTGLSVAGGIFYFGMQGAIIGPLILCSVVVMLKMGSSFLKDDDDCSSSDTDLHSKRSFLPSN